MKIQEYPQRIVIELTNACNLVCPMCPRRYMHHKKGYMQKELWDKLIEEIHRLSPQSVILPFWRGESLLHPAFADMLTFALDKGQKVHFSTNGTLMTKA